MVPTAEMTPDLGKGSIGHLLGQIHGDLAWHCHDTAVALLSEFFHGKAEQVSDSLLDRFDCAVA
jgi:hypothetical protein